MKKIMLTFLGVLCFAAISLAQTPSPSTTIINSSDCDLRIILIYADGDCIVGPTQGYTVLKGTSSGSFMLPGTSFIVAAEVFRWDAKNNTICGPNGQSTTLVLQ